MAADRTRPVVAHRLDGRHRARSAKRPAGVALRTRDDPGRLPPRAAGVRTRSPAALERGIAAGRRTGGGAVFAGGGDRRRARPASGSCTKRPCWPWNFWAEIRRAGWRRAQRRPTKRGSGGSALRPTSTVTALSPLPDDCAHASRYETSCPGNRRLRRLERTEAPADERGSERRLRPQRGGQVDAPALHPLGAVRLFARSPPLSAALRTAAGRADGWK